jgi:prepilin-type N-terminal cleavage/methylation domain-containing protein
VLGSKRGFTLTEVMIVLTILAVLAGLAVPGYFRTVEQSRANEALTTLNIIHMGQKIYRLNNATFWNGGANATTANIMNNLNVDISPIYYTDIDFSGVGANGYTCTITRNNVQGGAGTRFYQYVWNDTTKALTQNQGGAF